MRISGIESCSLVNGYGLRYVIFTQGCTHGCVGCHNPNSHDVNGGYEVTIEELLSDIKKYPWLDGITLSGGEPFLQEDECIKLVKSLPSYLDVWVYTGFDFHIIEDNRLTESVDVIVDGEFIKELKIEDQMYGSSNQRIIKIEKRKTNA